jgi:hypothetical protein
LREYGIQVAPFHRDTVMGDIGKIPPEAMMKAERNLFHVDRNGSR